MPSLQIHFPSDVYHDLETARMSTGEGVTRYYARLIHEALAHRIETSRNKVVEESPQPKKKVR